MKNFTPPYIKLFELTRFLKYSLTPIVLFNLLYFSITIIFLKLLPNCHSIVPFSLYSTLAALPTTTGGLAQRRLTLNVLRATYVHVRTALSAELLPPLRQTARCRLASLFQSLLLFCFAIFRM
jgi:hypothetical protein